MKTARLVITVRDDGRGIDPEQVRRRVIKRKLAAPETVAGLTEQNCWSSFFSPDSAPAIRHLSLSGRGVGLNVVQDMAHEAGGSVTVISTFGAGRLFASCCRLRVL